MIVRASITGAFHHLRSRLATLRYAACTRAVMRSILRDGRCLLALLLSAIASFTSIPAAAAPPDLDVQVQMVGEEIRAQVSLFVRASRQHVWEVLTDYERAPLFTPDLLVSKIVRRSGDTLRLFQRTRVRWGPFAVPIETL